LRGARRLLQSPTWAEVQCATLQPDPWVVREVTTVNAQECFKRTAECTRLAEATNDPGLREYLTKLASSWMQATTTAERNERLLAEGSQRPQLKTVHDLFC
jgi:hypothetical protein